MNTADSRVQLSFDVAASAVLTAVQRDLALRRLGSRLNGTILTVDASEHRSQWHNRAAARQRLAELLREAIAPPAPPRRATRPSRGSIDRRLTSKRRRAEVKRHRARPDAE